MTDLITDFALEFLETRDEARPFCLLYQPSAPHRNWMPASRHLDLFADEDLPLPETLGDRYDGRPAAREADMRIDDLYGNADHAEITRALTEQLRALQHEFGDDVVGSD